MEAMKSMKKAAAAKGGSAEKGKLVDKTIRVHLRILRLQTGRNARPSRSVGEGARSTPQSTVRVVHHTRAIHTTMVNVESSVAKLL